MADTSVEKNDEGRTGATRHGTLAGRVLAVAPGCLWFAARSTLRILAYATGGLCVAVVAAIIAFRYVDPPGSMLMASRQIEGQTVDQRWVPISRISPALVRAVIMSEDNQFCRHHGIDVRELTAAIDRVERIGTEDAGRGASTISGSSTVSVSSTTGEKKWLSVACRRSNNRISRSELSMAATNSVNFTSSRRSVGSEEGVTPDRSTLNRPAT